jgi:hypothetical protein
MHLIDNLTIVLAPGRWRQARFWLPLLGGFVIAWLFAFAINRIMLRRGRGYAVMHQYHGH